MSSKNKVGRDRRTGRTACRGKKGDFKLVTFGVGILVAVRMESVGIMDMLFVLGKMSPYKRRGMNSHQLKPLRDMTLLQPKCMSIYTVFIQSSR